MYPHGNPGGIVTTYLGDTIFTGTIINYQLHNQQGDIVGTTTFAGVLTVAPVADEFGNQNSVPGTRLGWLGQHERFTIAQSSGLIRMGHRLYAPDIGTFVQVDPVDGGSANAYAYIVGDPVNATDLEGLAFWHDAVNWVKKKVKKAKRLVRKAATWVRDRARNVRNVVGRNWRTWSYLAAAGTCIVASFGTCAAVVGIGFVARAAMTLRTRGFSRAASWRSIARDGALTWTSLALVGAPAQAAGLGYGGKAALSVGEFTCAFKCRT